jgi:hypothetical protein
MTNREKVARWQDDFANDLDDLASLCERASELLALLDGEPFCWIKESAYERFMQPTSQAHRTATVFISEKETFTMKIPLYLHPGSKDDE